jgi:putative methionine-R-sulfoxide reductase with GAF domain
MVLDLSEVKDLSEQGMCIQAGAALEVNRTLNLVLDLTETKTYINATGHVVWSDANGRSGIRFEKLPDSSARQLKTWLFFNTLTALSKTNGAGGEAEPEGTNGNAVPESSHAAVEPEQFVETGIPEPEPEGIQLVADAPTLNDIRQDIEALGSDMEASLDLIAYRTRLLTRAAGAAIALAEGEAMVCRASSGEAPPIGARFHAGSGFSGECVRTAQLQLCDDAETDRRVDRDSCRALGIRSMVAAPVLASGKVIGLLEVFSAYPNAFEESDAVTLGRLTDIIAQVTTAVAPPAAPATVPPPEVRETTVVARSFPRETFLLISAIVLIVLAIGASVAALMRNHKLNLEPQPASVVTQKEAPTAQPATLDELLKFAGQGDPVAQFALGARYAQGDGVKQDYAEAVRWFKKAADQGHVVAQATLGAYYWAGRGVTEDLSKAYFWSVLARAGGDEASKYRVAALTSRMTRPQVMQAEQMANEWLRQHQGTADARVEP